MATVARAQYASAPQVDLHDPRLYGNRELSWLDFNRRVFDQARDPRHPLLEQVKFLAIVCSNLDEFFMVRVASLLRKQRKGADARSIDGMSGSQLLSAVRDRAAEMLRDVAGCWTDALRPALEEHGIRILEPDDYTDAVRRFTTAYFRSNIYPLLTPLAFDPGHPFPLISNRSKNFAVSVRQGRRTKFARVKIPAILPRFIRVPHSAPIGTTGYTFVFLEDVIRENLPELFPGVDVAGAHLFRVIRDADIEVLEDSGDDLLESVDKTLKRLRHGKPSLLQADAAMPRRLLNTLIDNFDIEEDIVIRSNNRLDFSDWMALTRLPLPHLKDAPVVPRTLWGPSHHEECVFDDIQEADLLVHHPFDSFSAVETFVRQAAEDRHVAAIKMTLYRIGTDSPLIDMLIDAADAGKQVTVLVELKARFDERNNIKWATRLEEAGVHVVYGVENLKTHCKLCLVVRREPDGIRRYLHVGTGNYNPTTSQVYTDFGLFTANPRILDDASDLFNYLTGYSKRERYRELLVAPVNLRRRILDLIDREASHAREGRPARIIVKCNALTDPEIVRAFYRASRAGVDIDLIVRGTCVLRPGVEDVSERIRVRSIVGRFLEHSRVYYFENGGRSELFIGSADLMERNLDCRVETLCPIDDGEIARHVRDEVLETYLRDNETAYVLTPDGYERVEPAAGENAVGAQRSMVEWYTSAPSPIDDRQT